MTELQGDAVIAALTAIQGSLSTLIFLLQALAVVACFIYAAQLWRLVLQAKNSKNVM